MTPREEHRDYELTPGRVVYGRTPIGGFKLHVFGVRGSGVGVTISSAVPIPSAQAQPQRTISRQA
jgi:hypothetical protein